MITINDVLHGMAIAQAAGHIFNPDTDPVVSRVVAGRLAGGVTYTGYTKASIYMHVAGFLPGWGSRDLLWTVFHYPFVQLGCSKVFGEIRADRPQMLEFALKLGYHVEARLEGRFPDCDALILAMRREDCRWLKLRPTGVTVV